MTIVEAGHAPPRPDPFIVANFRVQYFHQRGAVQKGNPLVRLPLLVSVAAFSFQPGICFVYRYWFGTTRWVAPTFWKKHIL